MLEPEAAGDDCGRTLEINRSFRRLEFALWRGEGCGGSWSRERALSSRAEEEQACQPPTDSDFDTGSKSLSVRLRFHISVVVIVVICAMIIFSTRSEPYPAAEASLTRRSGFPDLASFE